MDIKKIQMIAGKSYNCASTECDGNCKNCSFDVSEEDEKDFYYTIWELCNTYNSLKRERSVRFS